MNFTIRRRRKPGETLHYKQSQTIRGRRYCVSNVKSPAAVKCASSNGFTHVLVGHKWQTIKSFRVALHGGHNAGEMKRTRPRSRTIPANKSCATQRGVMRKPAAADLGIAFIVNLPQDGMRRCACKAELIQAFTRVCVPRGIKGADLVLRASAVPDNSNHSRLILNTAGCNLLGVKSVTVVSRVLADASAVFGCSLSHRRIFDQAGAACFNAAYMNQWIFVFEDDAYFPHAASDVRALISLLLERVGQYYDLIWFGATSPVFETGEHVYHRRGGIDFRIRAVKSAYGSFAYAIRKHAYRLLRGIGRWMVSC